jgi:hypothetical protein
MDFLTRLKLEQEMALLIAKIIDLECEKVILEKEIEVIKEKLEI